MNWLIGASPAIGALCYLILAFEYTILLRATGAVFLLAFLYSMLWSLLPGLHYSLDFLQAAIWSASFILILTRATDRRPARWHLIWLVPLVSLLCAIASSYQGLLPAPVYFYFYLVCCVGTLLVAEQLIRSESGLVKTIGISIGGLFLFNLYIYAIALIEGKVSAELIETRALASATVALVLCLAPLAVRNYKRTRKIGLSRPLIFTTTSLLLAGASLVMITLLGFVLQLGEKEHGLIIQQFSGFVVVMLLGFYFSSTANRARARVWINKHFFKTKHDYNNQWRALSERLSAPNGSDDYIAIAIKAVASIYHSSAGACYIADGGQFAPVEKLGIEGTLQPVSDTTSPGFLEKMREDQWIYVYPTTDGGLAKFNDLIPDFLIRAGESLHVVPLINNNALIGFIVIYGDPGVTEDFDFEDLDLLRMVSKQISSFVDYQMLHEERLVTLQFEAFHQFTTFVMHDLKNLIAQQALVVENAKRFMNNPEFVEDAIKTIENSVGRMSRLIRKINENNELYFAGNQLEPVELSSVIEEAVSRCSSKEPVPILQREMNTVLVNADREALIMAFTHLISNAQDACKGGCAKVEVRLTQKEEMVECKVIDNGIGMDEEFIKHRLFKPFDSTKSTKGMGIGAYQCKRILSNIGATITVHSKVGEGSCFTISLPIAISGQP